MTGAGVVMTVLGDCPALSIKGMKMYGAAGLGGAAGAFVITTGGNSKQKAK